MVDVPTVKSETPLGFAAVVGRLLFLLGMLYAFLVAIGLMSACFKMLGEGSTGGLFEGVTNPFAGLLVGVLATVLVQSSSVSTSAIVALVAANELSMALAVPMVMGANIGTTVTNTIVSIGSVRRTAEFRRAFACATVHDMFNVLAVIVLLPIELATGYLRHTAEWIVARLGDGAVGADATFKSPVKAAVKAGVSWLQDVVEGIGLEGFWLAMGCLAVAVGLIFLCLNRIMVTMRGLLVGRIESSLNRVLSRSGLIGILVGTVITIAVQSSSITTSMLVPLAGAGVLSLQNAFPIVLGCNLGTTTTALIASLATGSTLALSIAFVHLLFNLSGTLLFYAIPVTRGIPIAMAERLAMAAARNKSWLLVYALAVFVAVPVVGILLFK